MKVVETKTFPISAAALITDRANVNIVETIVEQAGDEELNSVELFIAAWLLGWK